MTPVLPVEDPVVTDSKHPTPSWRRFFNDLVTAVKRTLGSASTTAQGASIAATAITPALQTGLYRFSYYARVTQAATVSSSLAVTIAWTDGAVSLSYTGPAMTGNTTSTYQSAELPLLHVDAGSSVQYSTTYASAGATAMQYRLDVSLEKIA